MSVCAFIAGCGGGGGGGGAGDGGGAGGGGASTTFSVGGTVTGLEASGLVLQNNAADDLSIAGNGAFTFTTPVASGASYAVTIKTQPNLGPLQTCSVGNGGGTVANGAVRTVAVSCVSRVAKFIYVTNAGSADVSAYTIDATTGRLTAVPGSRFAAQTSPRFATAEPTGRFLYVTNLGSGSEPPTVSGYAIESGSGGLTELTASPFDLSVSPVPNGALAILPPLIHPSGAFGYLAVPIPEGRLYGATIDAVTGDLSEVQGMPMTVGSGITGGAYDSAGRILFLPTNSAPGGPGVIATFQINSPSGVLTPIGTFPTGGNNPIAATLTPQDTFLLAPNTLSGTIAVFAVDAAAGTLTMVGSPVASGPSGSRPLAALLDRRRNVVYVNNANQAPAAWTLAAFRFDPTNGELTPLAGSPFAVNGATSGAFLHPSGRFMFQANASTGSLQRYAIDQTTGEPTLLPDVTKPAQNGPYLIMNDPSGQYLYVTNVGSATVSSYRVDPLTGALSLINTLPTGSSPFVPWIVGLQ